MLLHILESQIYILPYTKPIYENHNNFSIFPLCSSSSKKETGYASLGASIFSSKKFESSAGVHVGAGVPLGQSFTTGLLADIYTFNNEKTKYAIVAADFRVFFSGPDKPISPFISAQPGLTLYNKKTGTIITKGGFAGGLIAGLKAKPKPNGLGLIFGVGFQNISFATAGKTTSYNGVKIHLGISF